MTSKTERLLSYECDEHKFHRDLAKQLQQATGLVIVLSAFLFEFGMERYYQIFKILVARGVRVCVFIQEPRNWHRRSDNSLPVNLRKQLQDLEDCIARLEAIGVHVTLRKKIHFKVIVIDNNILWHGTLNVLSHNDNEESMTFFNSPAQVAWAISRFRMDRCQRCLLNPEFSLFGPGRPPIGERIQMLWERLWHRRFEMGYSQSELANNICLSPSYLSEMVNGKRDTKLEVMLKVCDALQFELIAIPRYLLPTVADLMPRELDEDALDEHP